MCVCVCATSSSCPWKTNHTSAPLAHFLNKNQIPTLQLWLLLPLFILENVIGRGPPRVCALLLCRGWAPHPSLRNGVCVVPLVVSENVPTASNREARGRPKNARRLSQLWIAELFAPTYAELFAPTYANYLRHAPPPLTTMHQPWPLALKSSNVYS